MRLDQLRWRLSALALQGVTGWWDGHMTRDQSFLNAHRALSLLVGHTTQDSGMRNNNAGIMGRRKARTMEISQEHSIFSWPPSELPAKYFVSKLLDVIIVFCIWYFRNGIFSLSDTSLVLVQYYQTPFERPRW